MAQNERARCNLEVYYVKASRGPPARGNLLNSLLKKIAHPCNPAPVPTVYIALVLEESRHTCPGCQATVYSGLSTDPVPPAT